MDVDRIPLSARLQQTIDQNLARGRAQRDAERRRVMHFPVRNRWLIVKARERSTWRAVWVDLLYLLRG